MNDEVDSAEQQKWDAYYADLPSQPSDPALQAFYGRFAESVSCLLPAGGTVLEAGCGSGLHSLSIARLGHRTTLMDFSEAALAHARRLFDGEGVAATFEIGDVLATPTADKPPEHDLVFNSGVLEHYGFGRQVAFLRGMAQRSRRHVLVLVPNRDCYWYWVWRVQGASLGRWPFGDEKAAADYRAAIEAAGLRYLGKAYHGADLGARFIAHVEGMAPELRQVIHRVHEQIASPAQQSYLVGFLATKDDSALTPAGFDAGDDGREPLDADRQDRYLALLADALANQLAAEHRLASRAAENAALQTLHGQERAALQAVHEQECAALRAARVAAEAQAAVHEQASARLASELQACRDAAERAQREVANLHASTSWRLTAPVRAIGRRLRR